MEPKYIFGLVGATVTGGVIAYGVRSAVSPIIPGPPEKPTLQSCLQVVFQKSTAEKRSGQVNAAAEYIAKGSMGTVAASEREAFYRDLDSGTIRQAVNACSLVYNSGHELTSRLIVNVRSNEVPADGAKVSLRNQVGVKCTQTDGQCVLLDVPFAALREDEIPLNIEYGGAYEDVTARFSELQKAQTLKLKSETKALDVQLVDCKKHLVTDPTQITLETKQQAWGLSCGAHASSPNDRVREVTLDGIGHFRYVGELGTFAIAVSRLSGGRPSTVAERYEHLQASGSTLDISYPKECGGPPTPKVNCDELTRNIQQRLENLSGAHTQTVTVRLTSGALTCNPQGPCSRVLLSLPPGSEQCPSFPARAKMD
jgi:hypothetical protein